MNTIHTLGSCEIVSYFMRIALPCDHAQSTKEKWKKKHPKQRDGRHYASVKRSESNKVRIIIQSLTIIITMRESE